MDGGSLGDGSTAVPVAGTAGGSICLTTVDAEGRIWREASEVVDGCAGPNRSSSLPVGGERSFETSMVPFDDEARWDWTIVDRMEGGWKRPDGERSTI